MSNDRSRGHLLCISFEASVSEEPGSERHEGEAWDGAMVGGRDQNAFIERFNRSYRGAMRTTGRCHATGCACGFESGSQFFPPRDPGTRPAGPLLRVASFWVRRSCDRVTDQCCGEGTVL